MTSFHIVFLFIYFLTAVFCVNRIAKNCVENTTVQQISTVIAVVFSGFLFRYWSLFAFSVAFIPLLIRIFLNFWKKRSAKRQEQQNFLLFIEKIILKMQNGNSFRASIDEICRESDAFVQQNTSLFDHFVSFWTQQTAHLAPKEQFYLFQLLSIDRKPHIALVQLKLLQRSLRLQIFFRRKSGQVSFQARFQSYFVLGIYMFILFLQIKLLSFANVKVYFYISLPLILSGFLLTQHLGKRLKWNL